ncbi:MAG: glycosyltransferase family 4 protein [Bradymonadales bacterium]|nr:glycosyltransferase family 4 protein [Bradymonadales bacterium]
MTPRVLMVSKPIVPPWNDSSKNLVRDILLGTDQARFTVLTAGAYTFGQPHIREHPIYKSSGGLAPTIGQNARVIATLLRPDLGDIHHFFFAPNPRTGAVVRLLRRLRHPLAIHTICSVPRDFGSVRTMLFADVHVALSEYTRSRLEQAGVPEVHHIPPCIPPLEPLLDQEEQQRLKRSFGLPDDRPVILYPGDYDYGNTASRVARAAEILERGRPKATWVFACRLKQPRSAAIEAEIRRGLADLVADHRAFFFRNVPRMLDLLRASDLVALPADTTYAKMDLPLVLLEAMALGRPVVVANIAPLDELPVGEAGFWVPPGGPSKLAEVISSALSDPSECARRGLRGAAIASSRYRRDQVARQYLELYRACGG